MSHRYQGLRERKTHIGGDVGEDHLLLARRLESLAEVSVVPPVHVAVRPEERGVRVHRGDLLRKPLGSIPCSSNSQYG